MRIAIISDIHGNEYSLDAVLNDIKRESVDQTICLGDIATLGPSPSMVIQKLLELECPCIMGNHDAFLIDQQLIHKYTEAQIIVEAVDWCRNQLSQVDLKFVSNFNPSIELTIDSNFKLLLFHGSPRSNMEDILSTTSPSDLDKMLQNNDANIMAGGHTHIQMLRQHRGILIINPGSVGFPFKEYVGGQIPTLMDHAEYAIIDVKDELVNVSLRRVPFKIDLFVKMLRESTNPLKSWLIQQYS